MRLHALTASLALLALSACTGTKTLADPTVVVRSAGGTELGVATNYGVIFLGATRPAGSIELESWFGDGPNIEPTVAEPVEGDLYVAETEIRLATVPMTFVEPAPGDVVVVRGRGVQGPWQVETLVRSVPGIEGILIDLLPELSGQGQDQTGAGVFLRDGAESMRLLGMVSGQVEVLEGEGAGTYAAVVGPRDLWRVVVHRKDQGRRRPWVYREDTM